VTKVVIGSGMQLDITAALTAAGISQILSS